MANPNDRRQEPPRSTPPEEQAVEVAKKLAAQFREGQPNFVRIEREAEGHFAVVRNPKLPPR